MPDILAGLSRFRNQVADGFKSFSPGSVGGNSYGNSYGGNGWGGYSNFNNFAPGSHTNYGLLAGDLWQNSAVAACLNWLITAFPEAAPCLKTRDEDENRWVVAPDDPFGLTDLLTNPNPDYDDTVLWAGTLISYLVSGNAYWFVVRDGYGRLSQLWYVPHFQVAPYWENSDFITGYTYKVNGSVQKMNKNDVIHFRYGVDPHNPRVGLAPLSSIAREVYTDSEATNYTAAVLKNGGVVGALATNDAPDDATFDTKEFTTRYNALTQGDKRGGVLAIDGKIKMQYPDNSPEKMALDTIRKYPEARICGAMGVPAMLVGLTSGVEHATYANMEQAEDFAWRNTLLPMQRSMAKQATMQLLAANYPNTDKYCIGFDTSDVRVLQDDHDALHTRARDDFKANLLDRAQALKIIGVDPRPEDEQFYYADVAPPQSGGFDEGVDRAADLTDPNAPAVPVVTTLTRTNNGRNGNGAKPQSVNGRG